MREFKVDWREADVAAVLDRVRSTRLPPSLPGSGWSLGCDADFLRGLAQHWVERYDWRAAVQELNRYPQFIETLDGFDVHFVHVVGEAEGRRPLVLTHGWPGSPYEFWQVIEPLAYPSRHGGNAEDAFDLVIPTLPGFGFSSKPDRLLTTREIAGTWRRLMTERLGYGRFRAQGGDWGSAVTSWLGIDHPANVECIHLNLAPFWPEDGPVNEEEVAWAARLQAAAQHHGAYAELQATRPQSLAWAAADNPLGQAAWIVERFQNWADLDEGEVESVFSLDQLITNVMLYVMTDSLASSMWWYAGARRDTGLKIAARCDTPTYVAAYDDPISPAPPASLIARAYNLVRRSVPARGGHFAAMEQPGLFVDEMRSWAADRRRIT